MTNTECPCGIARLDCEYHRPETIQEEHPQCVSQPLTAAWARTWMSSPDATMGIGNCVRRTDGESRMVVAIDWARRLYATDTDPGGPFYALIPDGWREDTLDNVMGR